MSTTGGQPGNQNAVGKRPFWSAVNEVLKQRGGVDKAKGLQAIAEKLITAAEEGEQWAIKELADRLDGKAAQQVILASDPEAPFKLHITATDSKL